MHFVGSRKVRGLLALGGLSLLTLALSCAASRGNGDSEGRGASSNSGGETGTDGDGSANAPGIVGIGGDTGSTIGAITILPQDPVLDIVIENGQVTSTTVSTGEDAPVVFTATADGEPIEPNWALDRGEIGLIGVATGEFEPSAQVAGTATVSAHVGSVTSTTTVTVRLKVTQNGIPDGETDTPGLGGVLGVGGEGRGGALDQATIDRLREESLADATVTWLYPYDRTVWPRGIPAPLLQWNIVGKNPTGVYIHLTQEGYEFEGFYAKPAAATKLSRHPVEPSAWKNALNSNTGDLLHVDVKLVDADGVYEAVSQDYVVAPGQLKGTVYYYSYNTAFANPINEDQVGAGVVGIKAGALEPEAALQGQQNKCIACHTISPDGSTLFAQEGREDDDGGYNLSLAFDLRNGGTLIRDYPGNAPGGSNNARKWVWPALWRDASFGIRSSVDGWGYPDGGNTPGYFGDGAPGPIFPAGVFRVDDGSEMTVVGLENIKTMVTPVFSPDGTKVVFNYWQGTAGPGGGNGHTLDVMDVECMQPASPPTNGEPACETVTFSNLRRIHTHPQSDANYVGWPAWLPDSSGVIFQSKVANGNWDSYLTTFRGTRAEIRYIPIPSNQSVAPGAVLLSNLNGVGILPNGSNGHNDDKTLNFEPTVNPVASGGYYWVVFTSRRLYGNVATIDPFHSESDDNQASVGPHPKKLWVAAIDMNPEDGVEPSHPAFYLPGQELLSPNMRAFWVVDPCKNQGEGCETGDECCDGFCRPDGGGGELVCSEPPMGCSLEFEKCAADADCCNYTGDASGFRCINERCAKQRQPIK